MLTKGAVEDLIMQHLSRNYGGGAAVTPKTPVKKVFLSDRELRLMYKPGERTLKVPANAIISPLALDWLDYNGIKIIR